MSLFSTESQFISNAPEAGVIPNATYRAFVFDVKKGPTADGSKDGITFTYKIADGDYEGETVREWKEIPRVAPGTDPTVDQNKKFGYIKTRLTSLGVPAERMSSVEAEDLIGKKVLITTKVNNQYVNVNKVVLDTADSVTDGSSPFGL